MTPLTIGSVIPAVNAVPEGNAPVRSPAVNTGLHSTSSAHTEKHASTVLYPAIKAAMAELRTLHPGFNDAVDRAFNLLHDAFWSECPVPASAAGKHPLLAEMAEQAVAALRAAPGTSVTLPVIDPGLDSLEREIQAKASTGPRVTPTDIEADICAEYGFTLDKALAGCPLVDGLDRVTVAVVVLRNGTKLVGVNYGAIDPANHSAEMGMKEARAAAVEQAWPLLGFRLRDELARQAT